MITVLKITKNEDEIEYTLESCITSSEDELNIIKLVVKLFKSIRDIKINRLKESGLENEYKDRIKKESLLDKKTDIMGFIIDSFKNKTEEELQQISRDIKNILKGK